MPLYKIRFVSHTVIFSSKPEAEIAALGDEIIDRLPTSAIVEGLHVKQPVLITSEDDLPEGWGPGDTPYNIHDDDLVYKSCGDVFLEEATGLVKKLLEENARLKEQLEIAQSSRPCKKGACNHRH